jgi:transcription antitermination protein NusB
MANRHLARSTVLQSLFEWDFAGRNEAEMDSILARNADEFAPGLGDLSFVQELAKGILAKRPEIDKIIEKAAPEWPLDKISPIDRNVLRIGLYELLFADHTQVPPKVAINEAIELAKTYGGDNSGKFVNGVLGTVYKELGEPGKDATPAKKKVKETLDPSQYPIEKLAGAVLYSKKDGEYYLGLVHDIFGRWTLSKGHINEGETETEGLIRAIKEEVNLTVKPFDELGRNEYVASHPEKGKVRKQVVYFLAEGAYDDLKLAPSGGLDQAKWFKLDEILDLNFYNDILPIVTKAINILLGREEEAKK